MVIQSLNGIYLHCAWATSIDGDDFSLVEFPEATFCGTYSDNSSTESTNPISYTWLEIGEMENDTEIDTADIAAFAQAQASGAQAQTIVNNDNIQASQDDTDMSTGNPNELIGTNQGTNNWTASAGLTISAQSGTIYNDTADVINYLHVVCNTAGSNYIAFDASALRDKLAELTDDNSFTLSADINMSTVFDMPVMVSDDDGTNIQIDFGAIEPELIPVPEETADGLWVFNKSTANCENEVAVSSQVVLFDLSNMGAGETLDIANLKIEGGALATPWRASLDEVANIANQAYSVANNTEQHFWFQSTGLDTGAHITEVDKDTWDLDPSNGGGNLLARSNGVAIRDGMIELATLQQSGLDVNTDDGQGNLVNIAHLGYEEGQAEAGTAVTPYASLGTRKETTAIYDSSVTYSKGDLCIYNDKMYVCRSSMSQPEPWTQGRWQLAVGNYSVAGGYNNVAGGAYSVALGANNLALGKFAYAEGSGTSAQDWGHAEGSGTNAGIYAHAEGAATKANGNYSHAQNEGTQALSAAQTAIGKYNIPDSNGDYAVIVGNGINGSPSNALTVEWSGDVVAAGDITDGGGNVLANKLNASALADYVIQRGTSGNWKYIKWASGRVECEGWYTFPSLTFSAASNVYRSVSNAFTIPSGIFTTAPGEGQAWIQGSNTDLIGASVGGLTTTGGNCQVWKRNSGNLTSTAVHMRLVYRG